MKRLNVVPVLFALLLLPAAGYSANVCVWNYDPLDRWYDAEVGDSVNSAYWVERTLADLGHTVTVAETYLPSDLSDYDIVFCLMGWYRC